jgi:hypothetical protein
MAGEAGCSATKRSRGQELIERSLSFARPASVSSEQFMRMRKDIIDDIMKVVNEKVKRRRLGAR